MKERSGTRRSRARKTWKEQKGEAKETIQWFNPDGDVPSDSHRRAGGQCRLVLSISRHLDPVALPAGLRLPQAVHTKQTSLLWLEPNPHTHFMCAFRIPGLTEVTSGVVYSSLSGTFIQTWWMVWKCRCSTWYLNNLAQSNVPDLNLLLLEDYSESLYSFHWELPFWHSSYFRLMAACKQVY